MGGSNVLYLLNGIEIKNFRVDSIFFKKKIKACIYLTDLFFFYSFDMTKSVLYFT